MNTTQMSTLNTPLKMILFRLTFQLELCIKNIFQPVLKHFITSLLD